MVSRSCFWDSFRLLARLGAQTPDTMRADLVSLGVRLGWVTADEKEEPALAAVRGRLRDEGEGLLLIYDNAVDAANLRPYLPPSGTARVLLTSNSPAWRGVATKVEIHVWPKDVGADYLIARTGRERERDDAEALSEALGGLTLAHEQAAAYCERVGVSLAEYCKRFKDAPARLLDASKDASVDYHGGLTVAKAFALAIDEAAKMHPAAEPLIAYAALLAPEPIPLFLFSEGREKFGEPLASQLAEDGLDEVVAALRAFALVDRETIATRRQPLKRSGCTGWYERSRGVGWRARLSRPRDGRCSRRWWRCILSKSGMTRLPGRARGGSMRCRSISSAKRRSRQVARSRVLASYRKKTWGL
jgi:hypothetical protein